MVKELVEAAPVIDAVRSVVAQQQLAGGEKISIIDLCSGKGFLSMFLSEMLDPDKVERCFLVDKAWPPHDLEGEIKPHHISDAHIYGERPESADVPRYSISLGEGRPSFSFVTTGVWPLWGEVLASPPSARCRLDRSLRGW